MNSAISPIKYGDNKRSRLSGIGSKVLVFKDVIKECTMSYVGSEKHEQ